ncbi:MAG TPA: hypothetical protein VGQ91_05350 [Ideonella sp.]|jgi:hypothetical protein|nr:hypothetical protein [Ideonella sp.]
MATCSRRRRKTLRAVAMAAWTLSGATLAGAQGLQWSGEATLGSDLTERGISPWPDSPVAQGLVAVSDSTHWSASLSAAAPLDRGDSRQIVGRGSGYWTLSQDWQLQARLAVYTYPQGEHRWPYDRTEASLGAAFRDLVSLEWSAVRLSEGDSRLYPAVDLGLRWPLTEQWAVTGGWGLAELPAWPGLHYHYGDAGLVWRTGDWRVSLRYLTTGQPVRRLLGEASAPHTSASITLSF